MHVVVRLSARAPSRLLQGGRPYFLASAGDDALVNIFDSVYDFILLFFIAPDTLVSANYYGVGREFLIKLFYNLLNKQPTKFDIDLSKTTFSSKGKKFCGCGENRTRI